MCVHSKKDLLNFAVLIMNIFVPFCAGMVAGKHYYGILFWIILDLIFFVYVEAFILCRHCPQYKEEGKTLRCHANWGLPKIPSYDPRPMNRIEQVVWLFYVSLIVFYWIPFFILAKQWIFLGWASVSSIVSIYQLSETKCTRCSMISCPINRVPDNVKQTICKYYPEHA
jgi:hypothetical protein